MNCKGKRYKTKTDQLLAVLEQKRGCIDQTMQMERERGETHKRVGLRGPPWEETAIVTALEALPRLWVLLQIQRAVLPSVFCYPVPIEVALLEAKQRVLERF